MRRSGGMVDAAVSKTVGGQPPCRFESDLRHHGLNLTGLQQKSMGFVKMLMLGWVTVVQETLHMLIRDNY